MISLNSTLKPSTIGTVSCLLVCKFGTSIIRYCKLLIEDFKLISNQKGVGYIGGGGMRLLQTMCPKHFAFEPRRDDA